MKAAVALTTRIVMVPRKLLKFNMASLSVKERKKNRKQMKEKERNKS